MLPEPWCTIIGNHRGYTHILPLERHTYTHQTLIKTLAGSHRTEARNKEVSDLAGSGMDARKHDPSLQRVSPVLTNRKKHMPTYYIILYYIILYYIILYYIILYYIILYYIILYYIILYYIILYYIILYYIILYYLILSYLILSYLLFYSILFYYIILYYVIVYHIIIIIVICFSTRTWFGLITDDSRFGALRIL